MELRNCPECGKLFVYTVKNLCPDCVKKEEEDFEKVRDYLYDNPGATIEEVSEKTGVDSKKVLEFLREGRLVLKNANAGILSCEMCGAPILTGRYCDKCAGDMKKRLDVIKKSPFGVNQDMKGKIHLSKLQKDDK
ncbi:TIGR03826 family flagellar region protein [Thermoanaerobacterium sp. DL9XJH110]|uniref:TIGR03826 family flagellar region protein n=1 Tax=Thermoanaerobacterium sp. DL9XJH110 TaxID=3386643 RepID=UPI003BB76A35